MTTTTSARRTTAAPEVKVPGTNWWYLVYLANLGWQPWFDPGADWRDWAVVAGVIALFVPLYAASCAADPTTRRRALWATTALGAAATMVNIGGSVLFVFAAAMAGAYERRRAMRWLIGLTIGIVVLAGISLVPPPYSIWGVLPSLIFVWIVGVTVQEDAERQREAAQLRIDNVRIEHLATVAERERIARDLHDLLGQSLTGLVVRAQLVQRLVDADPARAVDEAAAIEETARAALRQVRETVAGYRHASLDDEIASAVETLRAAGVDARVHVAEDVDPPPLVEGSLAMALREGVTNVVRHAGASRCTITIAPRDGEWRLEVADDGVGGTLVEGGGLLGIRERIAAIGGHVEADGRKGTTLVVGVPMVPAAG